MRDRDSEVFLVCLDTRKAFDTVWHEGLFHKLYQAGINGKLWRILWKWYRCSEGVVLLSGCSSTPYHVYQGVRQGGVLSMGLYQVYVAELLQQLSESGLGNFHYGRYYGSPCFADDLVLISTYPSTLRKMLDITFKYARKWRYSFNIKTRKVFKKKHTCGLLFAKLGYTF